MKSFVVFALCAATVSAFVIPPTAAGIDAAEIQQILDAINHPSTDPTTAAALEQMLLEILGGNKPDVEDHPIQSIPEIIDESIIVDPPNVVDDIEDHPIQSIPEIIDESIIVDPPNVVDDIEDHPIQSIPEIIDESIIVDPPSVIDDIEDHPIQSIPEIIDESIIVEQPGVAEDIEDHPIQVIDDSNSQKRPLVQVIININSNVPGNPVVVEQPSPVIIPEDVIVVETPEIEPEQVIVVKPEIPEPVIIAPIEPAPVITVPDTLN